MGSIYVKTTTEETFWATFGTIWATFLLQYLVTLQTALLSHGAPSFT